MSQSVPQSNEPRRSIDPPKPPVLIAPTPPARPEPRSVPTEPAKVVSPGTVLLILGYLKNLLPWVKRQPKWVRYGLAVPFLVVATFYYRDQRVGNGIFAGEPVWTADIGAGVRAYPLKSGEVRVVYGDGTELPADGYGMILVTADDEAGKKTLETTSLAPRLATLNFPLVVFFNASGFDESGLPTRVRQAADGKELWRLPDTDPVRLLVPQADGTFKVYTDKGEVTYTATELALKITRTPPEPVHAPAEFDKLTDEELKDKGFERITAEEYEKRFGKKPPLVRPLTIPPDKDTK